MPRKDVPALLASTDICLVPLHDVPLFCSFIPSKMFECFAAGKAVVGAVRGAAAEILTVAGAVVIELENSIALADAIGDLGCRPRPKGPAGSSGSAPRGRPIRSPVPANGYHAILPDVLP